MKTLKKSIDTLKESKNLIRSKIRWTQGWFARDSSYRQVDSESPKAIAWCAYGAVLKFSEIKAFEFKRRPLYLKIALEALQKASGEMGYNSVSGLNDDGDHDTVMKMYDRAINNLMVKVKGELNV